jgi:hypothetical protein
MLNVHLEFPLQEIRLLGPYFLLPLLSGRVYHDFLRNVLPELLQDYDMQTRLHLWIMHDGVPPRFLFAVREFLNSVFPEHWTGRGGPKAWPAPSSDLNPLDFYLWEHLKSTVYATEVCDAQDLQQRIQTLCSLYRTFS